MAEETKADKENREASIGANQDQNDAEDAKAVSDLNSKIPTQSPNSSASGSGGNSRRDKTVADPDSSGAD